ncbi:A subunit of putative glutamyl-tRNA amidotransferase [Hortaea werneckii]|nr:A subunit of putative glutamyl-tRNA amidotransferase [Hortaea werneckii]KAI7103379.1 A subunit of putative glutamyl-tRNA amidotransferase [Hortaea werneckii]KAI7231390.1 A subunit of putative glutamyl-tRNA amidotransferase [Hortaea werneckii]KAI7327934.1 A subunit of putative glutamyl-tRNA amidotransferase [Hortaea werneckii]KAI7393611.1 A subunit of putative glutamyl-tRNA amidotransferase [Hortaea werneckii]
MTSTNDPDVGLTLGNNKSTWLKRTARRFLAPQTKSEPQRPDSPCTPSRAQVDKPRTAIASLRMHLPSSTRKFKRNSLDVVVPLPPDDRGSPKPHARFSNDSKRYGTVPDGRRSSIADSFRSLGRKVSTKRPSLDATAEQEPEEDPGALAPVPSSPIAIPAAPPTLTLDLDIAGFDTPILAGDDGREGLRDLTTLREITSGRPPKDLTHPMAAQVFVDPRADTPASLTNDTMLDPRFDHPNSTPMPGTNMPIELDGVNENEASPVFERSVESPEKTPRTVRSIDALAQAYKDSSPGKESLPQTRKTTASTLSKCPSDMKTLCRQPSNPSEGDGTTSSESCSFLLPLQPRQQPRGITSFPEDDRNATIAASAQNSEPGVASAVVRDRLTVANDAESITTDYDEFKTQLLLEDTMPTRPASPEYCSDGSQQSLSLMPQLYQCIRDDNPSPTRGAGVNSWKFKIENWIGSPTGSQSYSQGHGTRAERQSISMGIDDSSLIVERDTASGTLTPTATAEAVSPRSDKSGLMGSKTEFQLRCSERNMRYNALHNDDFDISTQSNVQKGFVELPEYGNASPYAANASGDSDKENDPQAGALGQTSEKSLRNDAEQKGLWGWTPSAKQATVGVNDEEELHSGLEVDLRGSRFAVGFDRDSRGLPKRSFNFIPPTSPPSSQPSPKYVMLLARFCLRKAGRRACDYARPSSLAVSARHSHHNAIVAEAPPHQSQDGGNAAGPLAGKPIAIKDNIVTRDLPTTAASKALAGFTSPFDATVVRLLREHGALISSKTNLDEFGMGSHSQHSHFGAVTSPFSRDGQSLSAGGSSGGSAVAVATGQAWAALGTDTGGSVRLPAAYTGTVGFKPSYGLLSRWGVIQYANSLDTVGVLAKQVEDVRRVFRSLNAWCTEDPTSLPTSLRERLKKESGSGQKKRLRIGVSAEYNIDELSPPVRAAYSRTLSSLQSAGHTLHAISLPSTRRALSAYYILAPAEASSNLAKYDGVRYGHRTSPGPDAAPTTQNLPLYAQTRGEAFGAEVQRRILLGAYTLSSEALSNYFIQAQQVRRLVQQDFDRVFAQPNPLHDDHTGGEAIAEGSREASDETAVVDIILTPTAPTLPPTVEEVRRQSPVESYMNDVFTVPASLGGLPAVSVPVPLSAEEKRGLDEGDVESVGLQCIGQFGDDEGVLSAAEIIEGLGR